MFRSLFLFLSPSLTHSLSAEHVACFFAKHIVCIYFYIFQPIFERKTSSLMSLIPRISHFESANEAELLIDFF